MTPLKAIRLKCLNCVGGKPGDVRNCEFVDCSLYPFRLGKNPNRAGIGNPCPQNPNSRADFENAN